MFLMLVQFDLTVPPADAGGFSNQFVAEMVPYCDEQRTGKTSV